jgi:hypothetical protein
LKTLNFLASDAGGGTRREVGTAAQGLAARNPGSVAGMAAHQMIIFRRISMTIAVREFGANVIVAWNHGFLQEASALSGPWAYVPNAASPYTASPTNPVTALYFRATLLPSSD